MWCTSSSREASASTQIWRTVSATLLRQLSSQNSSVKCPKIKLKSMKTNSIWFCQGLMMTKINHLRETKLKTPSSSRSKLSIQSDSNLFRKWNMQALNGSARVEKIPPKKVINQTHTTTTKNILKKETLTNVFWTTTLSRMDSWITWRQFSTKYFYKSNRTPQNRICQRTKYTKDWLEERCKLTSSNNSKGNRSFWTSIPRIFPSS